MAARTYNSGSIPANVPVAQDANGNLVALQVDANGALQIAGTFSAAPPVGGATEAEQQAQTALLGGGLPAALSGSGNLKVAIVESTGGGLTNAELRASPVTTNATTASVEVELTRPADTTAYAAKDVISDSTSAPTVITFANFARVNGGTGMIVKARLFTDQKTNTGSYRLHLFHTAPNAINDNSPYLLLYANASNRIGSIDFGAMVSEDATNSTAAYTMRPSADGGYPTPNLWFDTATGSRAIYGVLETLSVFTPASGQKFLIELSAYLD